MKVTKMSSVKERKLLRQILKKGEILGIGSSRVTFLHPQNPNLVVKIAFGANAYRQNKLEVETFKNANEDAPLAIIESYGNYCVVMEKMEVAYDRDDAYAKQKKTAEAAEYLEELFGDTSDNWQIGRTKDGRYVSYDYGFDPHAKYVYEQCGWADEGAEDWKTVLREMIKHSITKEPTNKIEKLGKRICSAD